MPRAPDASCLLFFFFFFKQKTAYEIQGDWSSDVCSSDLCCVFSKGAIKCLARQYYNVDPRAGRDVNAIDRLSRRCSTAPRENIQWRSKSCASSWRLRTRSGVPDWTARGRAVLREFWGGDGALGCRSYQRGVLREDSGFVLRRRGFPLRQPARNLGIGNFQLQPSDFGVDRN